MVLERQKLGLAQFAQHAIDMDGAEAKGVTQVVLGERTGVEIWT